MRRAFFIGGIVVFIIVFVLLYMIGYKIHKDTGLDETQVRLFYFDNTQE